MTVLSTISRSSIVSSSGTMSSRHDLTKQELRDGCTLGLDTWADTSVVGRHAFINSYVDGKSVTAQGFASSLPSLNNIPIVNCSFAYDSPDGTVYILEINNALYLGKDMEHSLLCPNQCEDNDVRIDLRPARFYPDQSTASTISVPGGLILPIEHKGPLPCVHVRHPTSDELLTCEIIQLTSTNDWDPYAIGYQFSPSISQITHQQDNVSYNPIDSVCTISDQLLHEELYVSIVSQVHVDYDFSQQEVRIASAIATRKKDKLTPEELMRLWGIGLSTAKRTLKATTHQCLRSVETIRRRFRTDLAHMRYKRLSSSRHGKFYVDTLFSKVKSIRGYTCGNIFTNTLGFKKFFPLVSEAEGKKTMTDFIHMVGIPPSIHSDDAKVFQFGEFHKTCRKYNVLQTFTEPYSPWQNRAESGIRELKSYARKIMQQAQAPIRLWCFAYEYAAEILSLCAPAQYQLMGRTSYEHVMNYTPDISEYVSFRWYQWSYFWNEIDKEKVLCRWIGVAHTVGQSMCYYVLKSNGEFVARSTVIPVPNSDLTSIEIQQQMREFTDKLHAAIGDHSKAIIDDTITHDKTKIYEDCLYIDQGEDDIVYPWDEEWQDVPLYDETEATQKDLDEYIGTQVSLPDSNGVEVLCRVKGRKRDSNGTPIGSYNSNPILDSRVFDVEFPDGRTEAYSTNIIAESLYSQVDEDGFDTGILSEIVDHEQLSDAVKMEDGTIGRNNKPVITTKGWRVKLKWMDGSYDWLPLSQVKNSNPIMLAEYAVLKKIDKEPAFRWWVPHVLKKRSRMINKVKTRMRKGNVKFGIKIPTTVKEALMFDKENGNSYWSDAIAKEYENVKVAFQLMEDGERVPPGYQEITCHLIFEVKFDLRRKARYVAGGHLTKTPTFLTYSSVVSRESVRIAFLIAALNGLDVWAADIQNAYLNAPTEEKVWFRAGDEWGENAGRPVLIVRALYGLKGSGQAWRSFLAETLRNKMGFISSLADPDVWYKPCTKEDGSKYYAYLLIYVDDVISVDIDAKKNIDLIGDVFTIKEGSAGPPKVYLGANIQKVPSRSGGSCWGMSCEQYTRDAIKHVKDKLKEEGWEFNRKLSDSRYSPQQPFTTQSYRPELDNSMVCSVSESSYYQNLIGVLRWVVELGRIDINYEVAVLSQYLANPRRGHLIQAIHIFKYLDIHKESFLRFDHTYLNLDNPIDTDNNPDCKQRAMKKFYPDAKESVPTNAPEPRGKPVQINCFVDSDHAGNVVTRRSQTGILIYLNMAPIFWYSKKQNTIESSTFSSEFVALRIAAEKIISLRYKLRMFGVPLEGPANVFCDNEAVYKNSSMAASTLKKKHNSIAYHKTRECVASGVMKVFKEDSESNLADILTKSLGKNKRVYLRSRIMFDQKVKSIK